MNLEVHMTDYRVCQFRTSSVTRGSVRVWRRVHLWSGLVLVSRTGRRLTLASTQKLGLSSICCHKVTSFPTASIQLEDLPECFPEKDQMWKSWIYIKEKRKEFYFLFSRNCTWAKVESDSTKEVLVSKSIMIPDSQLEGSVCQVFNTEVFPG